MKNNIATSHSIIKWGKWFFPIMGSILVFLFACVLQVYGGFILPAWAKGMLSLIAGTMLLGYLLQLKVLNRIGGMSVLFIALLIIAGSLVPKATLEAYPEKASKAMTRDFDTAWKKMHGRDLFEEFSPHQNITEYLESLENFDIYRAGQIGLFACFGLALGICFLFPVDPKPKSFNWSYS